MLHWWTSFTLKINCLFTQWKWTSLYWILDLEGEVHSIWDLWISDLQECKDSSFFKIRRADRSFQLGPENLDIFLGPANTQMGQIYLPWRSLWGGGVFNIHHVHLGGGWPMGDQASSQVLVELQLLARLLYYLGKYGQGQWLGGFLGITSGWDPSICKSNQHPKFPMSRENM
jgi:hypothetical protein